jgi:hypothetical protein
MHLAQCRSSHSELTTPNNTALALRGIWHKKSPHKAGTLQAVDNKKRHSLFGYGARNLSLPEIYLHTANTVNTQANATNKQIAQHTD